MKKYAIIVAGGKGLRMKSDIPKQFMLLNMRPVLMRTIRCFYEADKDICIIVVLPENQFLYWTKLCIEYNFDIPHKIVKGGTERFFSVKNAIEITDKKSVIAIHDGVRPLVDSCTILNCFAEASKKGSAIPVIPLTDSIRKVTPNSSVALNRSEYCLVQTPQTFVGKIIHEAYELDFDTCFTDDASVVESMGREIYLVNGNSKNIKITNSHDLRIAELLLKIE